MKVDRIIKLKSCSFLLLSSTSQIPEKTWDSFITLSSEEYDDSLSTEWMNVFIVVFKIIIYLITFIANLFCAVISMSSLLLMTSMIRDNHKIVLCTDHFESLTPGRTYVTNYDITSPESIGWIWSLFVVMIAPQILSLYRCLKNCLFKNFERPRIKTLCFVSYSHFLSLIKIHFNH